MTAQKSPPGPTPPVKIADAIGHYYERQLERGRAVSTVNTADNALRNFFLSVLASDTRTLTTAKIAELREAMSDRVSRHTGELLADSTQEMYFSMARTFLRWCARLKLVESGAVPGLRKGTRR